MTLDEPSLTQDFPAYFVSNSTDAQQAALTTAADSQLTPEHAPDTKIFRKFKYPVHDPPPHLFQDTRSDLEKIQDIIKVSASILEHMEPSM